MQNITNDKHWNSFVQKTVPMPYNPNRKSLDEKNAYTSLKPEHYMLAMSSSAYLVLVKTVNKLLKI